MPESSSAPSNRVGHTAKATKRPDHVVFERVNSRSELIVLGMTPTSCQRCGKLVPERRLIVYRGKRRCPGCFVAITAQTKADGDAGLQRPPLYVRARHYLEAMGAQNCPEILP
jgi:hypothetical protein